MNWKNIFARKDLEALLAEAAGEHRLHRVLGPWSLTALGVGCIIGAGIFVVTGRAAALDAGPGVILSYAIAGVGLRAGRPVLCRVRRHGPRGRQRLHLRLHHAGRNLRLDHRLGLDPGIRHGLRHGGLGLDELPEQVARGSALPAGSRSLIATIPLSGGIINLPSVLIMVVITAVLVLGIRESARTNATLVAVKLAVVVFVIFAGWAYVNRANWTGIPVAQRRFPQEKEVIPDAVKKYLANQDEDSKQGLANLEKEVIAAYRVDRKQRDVEQVEKAHGDVAKARQELAVLSESVASRLPQTEAGKLAVAEILPKVRQQEEGAEVKSWGILGTLGAEQLAAADR